MGDPRTTDQRQGLEIALAVLERLPVDGELAREGAVPLDWARILTWNRAACAFLIDSAPGRRNGR